MTPDMKRLCDAVWSVEATQTFREATGEQSSSDANPHERRRYEAIVRAVLMALREPSDSMRKAAYSLHYPGEPASVDEELAAMTDHILGEPVTA